LPADVAEELFWTDGGRINYVEGGRGTRPVVVLHGLSLNLQSMDELTSALGEAARTLACDLPGHGKSDWRQSEYRFGDYADGITPFVAAVAGNGSMLIGFSTGAVTALAVAARLPDAVAGVVATRR
jgi:2-succinyl-6-hydroxy-2,4-cyclohexadiene-1-carboxylate synthase